MVKDQYILVVMVVMMRMMTINNTIDDRSDKWMCCSVKNNIAVNLLQEIETKDHAFSSKLTGQFNFSPSYQTISQDHLVTWNLAQWPSQINLKAIEYLWSNSSQIFTCGNTWVCNTVCVASPSSSPPLFLNLVWGAKQRKIYIEWFVIIRRHVSKEKSLMV